MGLAIGEVHPRPAGTSEASSASGRPRSSSNATQDVADLRSGMKKSITDLFTNIGFVDQVHIHPPSVSTVISYRTLISLLQNGCLESTPFPLIADLVEGLRVRGEEGITIYEYDWVGGVRARTLSRPETVSRLPPDGTQKQLPVDHRDIMYMYRLFVSTAVRAWNNTLAYAFGDGDAATSAHLSSTALYALSEVAARPDFQQLYELMASRPVAFWLTDYADEVCWDFDPQTIRGNCLANTLRLEAINYVSFFVVCISTVGLLRTQSAIRNSVASSLIATQERGSCPNTTPFSRDRMLGYIHPKAALRAILRSKRPRSSRRFVASVRSEICYPTLTLSPRSIS